MKPAGIQAQVICAALLAAVLAIAKDPPKTLSEADKLRAAPAMARMLQTQGLALHATVQLREAEIALRNAYEKFESVDQARDQLLQARLRLGPLDQQAAEARKKYAELEQELAKSYGMDTCRISVDLAFDCPAGSGGGRVAGPTTPAATEEKQP